MIDLKAELEKVKAERGAQHKAYVEAVKSTSREQRPSRATWADTFGDSAWQDDLWSGRDEAIAIGQGAQVTVAGTAHEDRRLVQQLDALRSMEPADDGGQTLDELFAEILDYVREKHATVRPRARLIRIFARLRPWDITCIVWDERLRRGFAQLGLQTPRVGVMQKHRALLDALWDRLGKPDTLEEQLWYSLLAHELSKLPLPPGYAETDEPSEPVDGPTAAPVPDAIHDPSHWLGLYEGGALPAPTIDAISDAFTARVGGGFVLPDRMLPTLHAALTALPARRFVVIGGLSGTGKSTFARLYAEALCTASGIDETASHVRFVAVRPDWTDPTGLLGHPNLLFDPPRWHHTPTLQLLLAAVADPTRPYVLILEEMNLARVEHYLAPLLTAMENPAAGLELHGLGRRIDGVPPLLPWPRNLFIIGTVNMDATTQAFSDKVLDRAFVWEMDGIDIAGWQARRQAGPAPSAHLETVAALLTALYAPLETAGRHFGYRVCDEVLAFCDATGDASAETLDAVVFSKVLPRLRGDDQGGLGTALMAVRGVCAAADLSRCVTRLDRMRAALQSTGVARFWS